MRCDEARAQLLAGVEDPEALEHLEGCPACFAAVEAADPVAAALAAARPAPAPVPAGLTARLQARLSTRRRPSRNSAAGRLMAAVALGMAVAVAVAVELLVGAEPARLAGLGGALLVVAGVVPPLLEPLVQVRSALLDAPALLGLLGVTAAGVSGLWLRLALQPPAGRWAR
ncbi:MAG TPA: hypothetical protein VKF59_10010 [Candidatus Dormibacteraeota bacterium]|nr:hypothetical protein [Candidatus Dormibacteraeota bacterium]